MTRCKKAYLDDLLGLPDAGQHPRLAVVVAVGADPDVDLVGVGLELEGVVEADDAERFVWEDAEAEADRGEWGLAFQVGLGCFKTLKKGTLTIAFLYRRRDCSICYVCCCSCNIGCL